VEAALKLHQDLDAINVAEVARLTDQLATARRDALEEAANEVDCGGCVNVGCVDPTNCWHKAAQDIRALAQEEPTA
jgi:DNA-binding IscR family transcriptional regulator